MATKDFNSSDRTFALRDRVDIDLFNALSALKVCEYAIGAMDALEALNFRVKVDAELREALTKEPLVQPDDGEALAAIGSLLSSSINSLSRLKAYVNEYPAG